MVARLWRRGQTALNLGFPEVVLLRECVERRDVYQVFCDSWRGIALMAVFDASNGDEIFIQREALPVALEECHWWALAGGAVLPDPPRSPLPLRASEFEFITHREKEKRPP